MKPQVGGLVDDFLTLATLGRDQDLGGLFADLL
jgi:hypothetical protein